MKENRCIRCIAVLLGSLLLIGLMGCSEQQAIKEISDQTTIENSKNEVYQGIPFPSLNISNQISPFVRRIFQDSKGDLWFGTNGDGIAHFNGDTLQYFSINEGFLGTAVRAIREDSKGNLWFASNKGLIKYNGSSFKVFSSDYGLPHEDTWSLCIDSKGLIWVGTLEGVCRFNGKTFSPFEIPISVADYDRGVSSGKNIHAIMEDSKGNMWFSNNGGLYIYDGKILQHLSEKDGLCNNSVNDILEDDKGRIWLATHYNGVCIYDGKSFEHVASNKGVQGTEVWSLYKDTHGNIWFPVEGFGVYRYDGISYKNYSSKHGLKSNAIQSVFEDREGRLWLGGWMGLFRYDGTNFFSVGKSGPWS